MESLSPERGRLRRPGRFFAVSAHIAFPREGNMRRNCKKRIMQRLCLCMDATFENPCLRKPPPGARIVPSVIMRVGTSLPKQSGLPGRTMLAVSPPARLSSSFIVRFKEISHAVPTSRLRRFWRILVLGFLQRKVRSPLLGLPTALFSLASRLHRAHQFTSIAYHFDKHLIRESV